MCKYVYIQNYIEDIFNLRKIAFYFTEWSRKLTFTREAQKK